MLQNPEGRDEARAAGLKKMLAAIPAAPASWASKLAATAVELFAALDFAWHRLPWPGKVLASAVTVSLARSLLGIPPPDVVRLIHLAAKG